MLSRVQVHSQAAARAPLPALGLCRLVPTLARGRHIGTAYGSERLRRSVPLCRPFQKLWGEVGSPFVRSAREKSARRSAHRHTDGKPQAALEVGACRPCAESARSSAHGTPASARSLLNVNDNRA